jgi:hypothetical protein
MTNESLGINQIDFLVRAMIERAPAWTMIRELVKNAIESAEQAAGKKEVKITSRLYREVPKLVIWNTGPGLSDTELVKITQLSSSVHKTLDLDANFGVGAKVSSLANNKVGMIYRSCKDGAVSQVILAYDSNIQNYVRVKMKIGEEELAVIDVTKAARKEDADLSIDWTEVMLLGNSDDQNTVEMPLATEGRTDKGYIATALYRRFYRIPEGVKIKIDGDFTRFPTPRNFETIWDRREKHFSRYEEVRSDRYGLLVHFFHDPEHKSASSMRQSASGALGSTTTTMCLVHKDEMYSVKTGVSWSAAAPAFGIPFGSKELCVHVELDDKLARPSQYRERLIRKENGADIAPEEFAHVVREVMPQWVKEVVSAASPDRAADYDDLQKELQLLLDEYKLKSAGRKKNDDGMPSEERKSGEPVGQGEQSSGAGGSGGGDRATNRNVFEVPEGATRTKSLDVFDRAPEIIPLTTEEQVAEKDLVGKAAYFVQETGKLFVNCLYDAVGNMVGEIEVRAADETDVELVRELATEAARRAIMLQVGKAVVFALAKRNATTWSDEELRTALSKVCLSIAADDYRVALNDAHKYVRQQLRARQASSAVA